MGTNYAIRPFLVGRSDGEESETENEITISVEAAMRTEEGARALAQSGRIYSDVAIRRRNKRVASA